MPARCWRRRASGWSVCCSWRVHVRPRRSCSSARSCCFRWRARSTSSDPHASESFLLERPPGATGGQGLLGQARACGHLSTWLNVSECPFDRDATPTAPLHALAVAAQDRLALTSEYRVPLAELRELAQTRCEAQALFRFARVPYLAAAEPDGSRILGDLRYDRKRGLDFSDIRLMRAPGGCPAHVPPWRSPRTDILSEQN